jgi:hypothetical protein
VLAKQQIGKVITCSNGIGTGGCPPSGSYTVYPQIPVAWRSDGKVLAAILPDAAKLSDSFTTLYDTHVTLYDTSTGKVLTKLGAESWQSTSDAIQQIWSPSGEQLALVDVTESTITIWGASSLASMPPLGA